MLYYRIYCYIIYKVLCYRDLEFERFAIVGTSNEQVSGRKRKATDTTKDQAKRPRVNESKCCYVDRYSYEECVCLVNLISVLRCLTFFFFSLFFSRGLDVDCLSTQSISSRPNLSTS